MHNVLTKILAVIRTLNEIDCIKGEQNMDRMLGSIQALKSAAAEIDAAIKEQEKKPSGAQPQGS